MHRLPKISQCAALASAIAIGWSLSEWKNNNKQQTRFNGGISNYVTVSAAVKESLVPTNTNEFVPEPAQNAPRISQIMRFGFPSLSNIRSMEDFVISYDTRNRVPNWVFEHLTASSVAKNPDVTREKSEFHEDTSFHEYFRAKNSDYKHSGFDRGHLAAAGNHRQSQKHCDETFALSNMAPQVGRGFNRDKWNDLESYCRRLTKTFKNVYVVTGPLYLPRQEGDGKLYVKYQVIGSNHVAVPTHFYKIVVCEDESSGLEMESFLLPNQAIDNSVPIEAFHVPSDVIERASGHLFFDKINKNRLNKINGKKVGWF